MKCDNCDKRVVFSDPALCKEHFLIFVEEKVVKTIQDYSLIKPHQKIAVAVSGGKDSLTVLYILHKLGYNVSGIAIDEGIKGYRDKTLLDLEKFCNKFSIPLEVVSFTKEVSLTMDHIAQNEKKKTPCNSCGILRRYVLNKNTKNYDILATGHNRDDEAQVVFMNFINGTFAMSARLGPKTGVSSFKGFTQRVKPLYFISEKEVMTYAFLKGFAGKYSECPYAYRSLRFKVRDLLNTIEVEHPGVKKRLINDFIEVLPSIKKNYETGNVPNTCVQCGEPAGKEVCNTCKIKKEFVVV